MKHDPARKSRPTVSAKACPRPTGVSLRESHGEPSEAGRQRTASAGAPTDGAAQWQGINWDLARREVRRLQMRIAKAVQEGRWNRVRALQHLLTHSLYAKALAVKRVTSNKGKKTPGVDGVLWKSARARVQAMFSLQRRGYRPQPLRRIYIPKKNGKKRPLSIPTMKDRAMQALYKLALAPVAETTADRNSYGFREGRSCADAIAAGFNALNKPNSATWVLEGISPVALTTLPRNGCLETFPWTRRFFESGFRRDTSRRTVCTRPEKEPRKGESSVLPLPI